MVLPSGIEPVTNRLQSPNHWTNKSGGREEGGSYIYSSKNTKTKFENMGGGRGGGGNFFILLKIKKIITTLVTFFFFSTTFAFFSSLPPPTST